VIRKITALTVLILLFTLNSSASDQPRLKRWWERHKEGWFFYNEKYPPKKEEKKEKEPTQKQVVIQTDQKPLFTERMRKKAEELLSTALENPTPENVKAYMEFNKYALTLASNFALVWQKVLMSNPELMSMIPEADPDKAIYYRVLYQEQREKLMELSRKAGLFFFFSSSCPYCRRQAYYLRMLQEEIPFYIKAISLDGGTLPEFPNASPDNGISARLNVTLVPSIFLAFPEEDRFARISSGLVSISELKRRLLYYVEDIDRSIYSGINDIILSR